MTHFCPNCWKTVDADIDECPSCGFRLADYDGASYERKLLLALKHPVRENRLLAVQVLGRIRSRPAVTAFRQMLAATTTRVPGPPRPKKWINAMKGTAKR